MEGDDNFFEKEVNYKRICRDIIRTLNKIKRSWGILDKVKLADYQNKALSDLKENLEPTEYKEYTNSVFIELMDLSCQVEEVVVDISSTVRELTKNINYPSERDKRKIYSHFKIDKITPEFRRLYSEFNSKLLNILVLIQKLIEKYIVYYKEE
jgi:hypothetical protein